jgi:hypothetical protein
MITIVSLQAEADAGVVHPTISETYLGVEFMGEHMYTHDPSAPFPHHLVTEYIEWVNDK